jgi:hypothetical protein
MMVVNHPDVVDSHTIDDARSTGATFVAKPIDFQTLGRLIRDQQPSA